MKNTIETTEKMSETEAKECVKAIKSSVSDLQNRIIEFHDKEGWRALGYKSWKECCQKEFNFSVSRGYQLLKAATFNSKRLPLVDDSSQNLNERQVRELEKAPEAKQTEILNRVNGNGHATAAAIAKEVKKEIEEEKEKPKIEAALTDELGTVIPSECLENWQRGNEVADLLSDIRKIKLKITAAEKSGDKLWYQVHWQDVQINVKRMAYSIGMALPYAVCPFCQGGKLKNKCTLCKGWGLLSKFAHSTFVPEEMRKVAK